jgi:2-dehydropantoate 2-reductase
MKICVFGAGAVGGHLAARLAASGNDVSVIARGAHLRALQEKGVRLLHGEETIAGRVRAAERAAELGPQDLVFVTLKANLLDAFARDCAPLLGPKTGVVFAQNGIPWWYGKGLAASRRSPPPELALLDPGGHLARAIGAERIMGGVIYSANEVVEPGVVMNKGPGSNMLVVGEADDAQSERVNAVRDALERSGMSSPPARDIRAAIWAKLLQNLANSTLSTLTGGTVAELRTDPEVAKVAARIAAEGGAVAAAHGIDLAAAPQRPGGGHSSGMPQHKTSMLQDYERGRPMEIAAQLVIPLAFGRVAGVATPTLETLVPLVARKAAAKGLYSGVQALKSGGDG